MTFSKTFTGALSLCLMIVALGACSGAAKKSDSYTSGAGAVTLLESDREACSRSCNAEFERCGGTKAAQSTVGRDGQLSGVLGAQADCKASMRSCLNRCKVR